MKKHTILIIDDEEVITLTMGYMLRNAGYTVFTALSGEEGLKIFNKEKPQLIITDLMMDSIDGIEVLRQIKEAGSETMVIILTGYGELDTAIEAVRLGASDYLLKPCKKEEILHRLRNCFEKLEMRREIKAFEKIVPVCCACRKIRNDNSNINKTGEWMFADEYIERHSDLDASHTYCDECADVLRKEIKAAHAKIKANKK